MATVIFDFDSTLITCESLEVILSKKHLSPEIMQEIKDITDQGMSGTITFLHSLQKRMSIVSIYKQDFIDFGTEAIKYLTPGIKDLVRELRNQSVDVWIVSGAVRTAMLPVGIELDIPPENIIGIDLVWSASGEFLAIDESKPINHSKWQGAKDVSNHWSGPKIAIGDGITDYAIYEHKLVDYFIAFTENAKRQAVLDKGVPEADSIEELRKQLRGIIDG